MYLDYQKNQKNKILLDMRVITTILDASSSNIVKKLKISKSVGISRIS